MVWDFIVEHFPAVAGLLWIVSVLVAGLAGYLVGHVKGELDAIRRERRLLQQRFWNDQKIT